MAALLICIAAIVVAAFVIRKRRKTAQEEAHANVGEVAMTQQQELQPYVAIPASEASPKKKKTPKNKGILFEGILLGKLTFIQEDILGK